MKGKAIFNQEFSYRKIPKEIELTEEEAMIFNVMKTEGDDLSMKNKLLKLFKDLFLTTICEAKYSHLLLS